MFIINDHQLAVRAREVIVAEHHRLRALRRKLAALGLLASDMRRGVKCVINDASRSECLSVHDIVQGSRYKRVTLHSKWITCHYQQTKARELSNWVDQTLLFFNLVEGEVQLLQLSKDSALLVLVR